MICPKIQQVLLMSDRPDQPAADVRAHLADCAACRGLQRRLFDVEQQIPLLPVPASTRRDGFLQQIRQGNVLPEPTVSPSELWLGSHRPTKERGLLKLAMSLALAASLLLFALGWWVWPHSTNNHVRPADPLVVRQQDRDHRLAKAQTPRERVQVLADLAKGLHDEARQLAGKSNPEELRVVAQFYREVVLSGHDNLLKQARQLSPKERTMLEGVAEDLGNAESDLLGLAEREVEEGAAAPLREIAVAARESHDQLRQLLQGKMS